MFGMTPERIQSLPGDMIRLDPLTEKHVNGNYINWLNDTEVSQYLETRHSVQNHDSVFKYVERVTALSNVYFFAIILLEKNCHVGNIKLEIIPVHRRGEISLLIGEKSCWGKGIGSESIKLVRDFGLECLQLYKLTAGCYSNNLGSAKAFEKAGFIREAVLADHYLAGGNWVDRWCYAYRAKQD